MSLTHSATWLSACGAGSSADHQVDLRVAGLQPRPGDPEVGTGERIETEQCVELQRRVEVVDGQRGVLESFDVHAHTLPTGSVGVRWETSVVERYIELGLRLGRLLDGLVDAYYGPAGDRGHGSRPSRTPDPAKLAADARRLIADLDSGEGGADVDAHRRRWIRGQARGLLVTAQRFAGRSIGFVDEVEQCYGVRPTRVDDDEIADAQQRIDAVLPGTGSGR